MTSPAAISGSLVNMRNVGTHKSVALTIHVPEELARQVIAAFGWPTAAAPVPVAIARLHETPAVVAGQDGEAPLSGTPEGSRPATSPSAPKRIWSDLPASQQAAIRCGEPDFRNYLRVRGGRHRWPSSPDEAADCVREFCGVESRSELDHNLGAKALWRKLDDGYLVRTGKMAEPR